MSALFLSFCIRGGEGPKKSVYWLCHRGHNGGELFPQTIEDVFGIFMVVIDHIDPVHDRFGQGVTVQSRGESCSRCRRSEGWTR